MTKNYVYVRNLDILLPLLQRDETSPLIPLILCLYEAMRPSSSMVITNTKPLLEHITISFALLSSTSRITSYKFLLERSIGTDIDLDDNSSVPKESIQHRSSQKMMQQLQLYSLKHLCSVQKRCLLHHILSSSLTVSWKFRRTSCFNFKIGKLLKSMTPYIPYPSYVTFITTF